MTFPKRWALSVPLESISLGDHARAAQELEDLGYNDAWSYEIDGTDCFTPLAVVAQATNMRIGTAIANVYTRGPATLAQSALALAEVAPGRFVLGIGSGSQPIVEMWNGGHFDKPATRVREMVGFLRQALAGERVVFEGKTFSVNGFRLSRPVPAPVPIYVGALREGMLRVAGETADGVIINWLSAEDVKKSVAVVREAATAAGRNPDEIEITARIMVNIDPPGEAGDLAMRRYMNNYLHVPVYAAFHRWLGRTEALTPMWEAWKAGDRRAAVSGIPQQTVDELVVHGSPEERVAHIRRYLDAGVDTVSLLLNTAESDPEKRAALVMQEMRAMAPANH